MRRVRLEPGVAEIGARLLDDAHMAWVAAAVECEHAFHAWSGSVPGNGAAAFCAYRAALDREEAAAQDLQRLCELAQPCCDVLDGRDAGVVERRQQQIGDEDEIVRK
jgi:hypothetical protein